MVSIRKSSETGPALGDVKPIIGRKLGRASIGNRREGSQDIVTPICKLGFID